MIKRKRTKGQTTIYKTIHRKLKIEQHELTNKKRGWTQVLRKGKLFLFHIPYLGLYNAQDFAQIL